MDAPINVWNEIRVTAEGISISLLSETGQGGAVVEDETWFTFDELQDQSPQSPISLNLSQGTLDSFDEQRRLANIGLLYDSAKPSLPEAGDVLTDENAPHWAEDDWVEVVEVLDARADEYVVQGYHEGEKIQPVHQPLKDKTVADKNPSYPSDDRVVIAQYKGAGDHYAFPVSRLK